jgi:signal transduction histidine kinase/CheY-like chemotaxis protein/iron only hydrogenase large subunit-like protein
VSHPIRSLPQIIYVDKDKCANCHACIAVCPVKICNDGSGAYVNLNSNTCIGCGRCLSACTHGARYFADDFEAFMRDVAAGQKMVAITAPSAVSNFPNQYLRLNGWLKSLGVDAVFDVSIGAELSAKSYAAHIRRRSPQVVIAQPCPAIVTYVQVHRPELLRYLAPVDSPMVHTMKMVRRYYYPRFKDHRIVVLSPCPAKKREQWETGYGDFNVTFASVGKYLSSNGLDLARFPEEPYQTPTPDTAVLFPKPGGLAQTLERWMPGVANQTRTIEGHETVYRYLAALPETIRDRPATIPLLIDCLNCRHGCNCGPAALTAERDLDAVEYQTNKRHGDLREEKAKQIGSRNLEIERLLYDYWNEEFYSREYADLSANNTLRHPSPDEQTAILHSMRKYSPGDQYNCCSCGYGTCLDMTTAIFNGLNRPENCHHYLAREREDSQRELTGYRDHLEKLVEDRTSELRLSNERLQREIVERLRAEEELQTGKHTLKEILYGSPIPQFVIDHNHKILYWNDALARLTGIAGDSVTGTDEHWRAFYKERRPCLVDLLVDGIDSTIPHYYNSKCSKSPLCEGAYVGTDFFGDIGEQGKWLYYTAVAIRDVKGRIVGGVETLEDITDRRRAEIELAKSQREADAANVAKSRFLANMSHEMRTPMTAILGYLDLLSEGCDRHCSIMKSDVGNPIDVILRNGKHLLQIIDDILDVSKIEAGKMEIERTACSPRDILEEVASLMKVRAVEKGLKLDVEYPGAMPEAILTNSTRLRQILINLLGNAVKFTETGTVRLRTEFENDLREPLLQIHIIDTGIGMSADAIAGLFKPFTQADESTSRKFGGTGLGLAVSKRLAELLGGRIEVTSEPGRGSTFTLKLPTGPLDGVRMLNAPKKTQLPSGERKPGVNRSASASATLRGRRLLLAEDGPDNQRFISFILTRLGADVTVVENGLAAFETAIASRDAGNPFDLILMDMQMPVMDGYQAAQKLRAANWPRPIVALTAHAMKEDEQKCLDAGCDGYLTKPIDRRRLMEIVAQWATIAGDEAAARASQAST